jgi:proteasome lid subunit RPN8/RPN11
MVLERTLLAAAPNEGCALLLGQCQGSCLILQAIWPCCNTWQPAEERLQRFRLDPREQLLAQRWGRSRGLLVLGAAHSHPSSEAVPSTTDRQLCFGPTLMLIRSGLQQGLPALRAWWIPENEGGDEAPVPSVELPIDLLPDAPRAERLGE